MSCAEVLKKHLNPTFFMRTVAAASSSTAIVYTILLMAVRTAHCIVVTSHTAVKLKSLYSE